MTGPALHGLLRSARGGTTGGNCTIARSHGVTEFLRAFEDFGQQFFNLESDFLIVLDDRGNIDRVNPAFERILGYAESDVTGKGLMHIIRVDDWAAFLRTFTSVDPSPIRLLCKVSGEVGVKMIAFRFKNQRGYLVMRPIGKSQTDTP